VKYLLLLQYTKLCALHKLHFNGESPILYNIQRGTERNGRIWKVSNSIEILKQCFKIFAYEDVWHCLTPNILTPNILTLCRDDLLSDGPPVTDEVVSFLSCINPFHLPSLYDHVPCCPNSIMDHVLPLKFCKIFSLDLNSNFRLVSGVWEDSPCIVGW
jgi:hypothetical protein